MQGTTSPVLRQWKNVFVTHFVESLDYREVDLKGTLFLTDLEKKIRIHWVPDPDQDDNIHEDLKKGYEIDVNDLQSLTCRRLPGSRYRAVKLTLNNENTYGPFQFRLGGATDFITNLGELVDLVRSTEDATLYHIKLRPPLPFASIYELPGGHTRTRSQLASEANLPGGSAIIEIGASLRRKVWDPMNALVEGILNSSVVTGSEITEVNGDYSSPTNLPFERVQTTEEADYSIIHLRPSQVRLPPITPVQRGEPLTLEQWKRYLDPCGRVTCVEKLRKIIFQGGVEPSLRPVVWKYLLGYYLWNNTAEENEERRIEKHREYHTLKKFWKEMSIERLDRFSLFRERKCYIEKDVPRTDRKCSFFRDDSNGNLTRLYDILLTYTVYNMDFGYFQGMNDLLALILYVIQNEEESFWCFVGLMERLESNFDGNLNAVRQQFYQLFELIDVLSPAFGDYLSAANAKEMPFCFRWLLIQFKREFSYSDVMVLWEAFWSEHLTKNFHIFVAAAILLMHSKTIMERKLDANSILKMVNEMTGKIPLETTLIAAAQYVEQLNKVLDKLPQQVLDLINGPSLSTSAHAIRRKAGENAEATSPRLDYTWGLLNEELEDLMGDEPPSSSIMVPLP